MERFIKEYASYKRKDLININKLYNIKIDNEMQKIESILKMRNRELITTDETIRLLTEI